jgi:hypothetical protein
MMMSKKKIFLVVSCALVSYGANAQVLGTLPPYVEGKVSYSKDSDKFYTNNLVIGASHESGFGFQIGKANYWGQVVKGSSDLFQGTYVEVQDDYEIKAAFGIRNTSHFTNLTKLGNDLANKIISSNPEFTPSDIADIQAGAPQWANENIIASGGSASGSKQNIAAEVEVRLTMTDSLNMGASVSTDIVASEKGLQNGITYTSFGFDFDLQLADHLGLVFVASDTIFSDDNNRILFAARANYDILPEYGLSTFYRVKAQWNSNPATGNYFSPDRLYENAIGISLRKHYEGLIYTASVDYGFQNYVINGEHNSTPIYTYQIGVQTQPGKRNGKSFGTNIISSNNNSINSTSSGYHWYGVNFWMKVPF